MPATAAGASGAPRREPYESYMAVSGANVEHLQAFAASANAVAAVEGIEFVFHKELLAQRSKVLANKLSWQAAAPAQAQQRQQQQQRRRVVEDSDSESSDSFAPQAARAAKRRRGENHGQPAGADAAAAAGGLLQLDSVFAGFDAAAVRSFLSMAYAPASAPRLLRSLLEQAGRSGDYRPVTRLLALLDYLDAPAELSLLESLLIKAIADCEPAAVDGWMPLMALADGSRRPLPRAYKAALSKAVSAVTKFSVREGGGAHPVQRLCAHSLAGSLSPETMRALLLSSVCAIRTELRGGLALQPELTGMQRPGGSHTWEWRPCCTLEDDRAQEGERSRLFTIGGVQWRLDARLNGHPGDPASRGHVSLFLKPVPATGQRAARRARFAFTIDGKKGSQTGFDSAFFEQGLGWRKFCTRTDLISKQLMADGLIRVKVEISELEVYDM